MLLSVSMNSDTYTFFIGFLQILFVTVICCKNNNTDDDDGNNNLKYYT